MDQPQQKNVFVSPYVPVLMRRSKFARYAIADSRLLPVRVYWAFRADGFWTLNVRKARKTDYAGIARLMREANLFDAYRSVL